jgi:hypothetical protein
MGKGAGSAAYTGAAGAGIGSGVSVAWAGIEIGAGTGAYEIGTSGGSAVTARARGVGDAGGGTDEIGTSRGSGACAAMSIRTKRLGFVSRTADSATASRDTMLCGMATTVARQIAIRRVLPRVPMGTLSAAAGPIVRPALAFKEPGVGGSRSELGYPAPESEAFTAPGGFCR